MLTLPHLAVSKAVVGVGRSQDRAFLSDLFARRPELRLVHTLPSNAVSMSITLFLENLSQLMTLGFVPDA